MKKLFVVLFVVLFAATSAYAVEFTTSGSYYARGSWISNDSGLQEDAVDYGYYDHELDLTTTIVVADNTKVIVNFEIQDDNWDQSNNDDNGFAGGSDDNIQFKRVFSSHTFTSTGTTLDLGLMTGGAWATDFANSADGRYRIKVAQATPVGTLFAILEKNWEEGARNSSVDDAEDDDGDFYYLAGVFPVGPINIKPLFGYGTQSQVVFDRGGDGMDMFTFQLGIDGSFDVWGFESDFVYISRDFDPGDSFDNYGAYVKPWVKLGPAKLYGIFAWVDEDDGVPLDMGDDFEPLVFFGNWNTFGPTTDANDSDFTSCALYMLGLEFAATDALSFNGAFAYLDSTYDVTGSIWDGADAWEFDLGMGYKISDAVKYSVAFGYGDIDLDDMYEDPDGGWRLLHRFDISF